MQYAQHIPVNVIARMLGFPVEDDDLFREFVHDTLENVNHAPEERMAGFDRLDAYIDAQIEAHQADEVRVTTSRRTCSTSSSRGRSCRSSTSAGRSSCCCWPGIDTTWSAIGSSLWHLAGHADDRRRLVDEPELMPVAIEEFLRAYAPVTMARLVAKDHDFHGCPMKADDWVLLPFPAANRDPAEFPDADEVIVDRLENRHAAFGLGIHRCLGSNLARLEVRVAVEEFLARFPDFELADPDAVRVERGSDPRPAPAAGADPRRRLTAGSGHPSSPVDRRCADGRGDQSARDVLSAPHRADVRRAPIAIATQPKRSSAASSVWVHSYSARMSAPPAIAPPPTSPATQRPPGISAARIKTTPTPTSITPSSGVWSKPKTCTTGR